ncbi:MAG: hypothetical protein ILM98_00035 [Kiritimatiellae bacterium]|nr:hypothetical protein [Kiritimatiellia bacterium]
MAKNTFLYEQIMPKRKTKVKLRQFSHIPHGRSNMLALGAPPPQHGHARAGLEEATRNRRQP